MVSDLKFAWSPIQRPLLHSCNPGKGGATSSRYNKPFQSRRTSRTARLQDRSRIHQVFHILPVSRPSRCARIFILLAYLHSHTFHRRTLCYRLSYFHRCISYVSPNLGMQELRWLVTSVMSYHSPSPCPPLPKPCKTVPLKAQE